MQGGKPRQRQKWRRVWKACAGGLRKEPAVLRELGQQCRWLPAGPAG